MSDQFVLIALASTAGVAIALNILNLAGASLYDIEQVFRERERLRHPFAKRYRQKPMVSIIIPAYNQSEALEATLNSILKSSYRAYKIIIVNNASTDDTKEFAREYINSRKSRVVKLLSVRKHVDWAGAVNAGFKSHARGELVMVLECGSLLGTNTLRNITRHFTDENTGILIPSVRILERPSIISLLQQFKQLAWLRQRKLNSLINAEWDASGSGVVYRRELFKQLKGFKSHLFMPDIDLGLAAARQGRYHLRYASDAVIYARPVTSYLKLLSARYRRKLGVWQALYANKSLFFSPIKVISKPLTWFRLPLVIWEELMVFAEPIVVGYLIYLAVAFHQPVPAAIGWAAVSFLFGFAVWADNQMPWRQKIKLTAYIPITYPLSLVMTLVDIAAALMSMANINKITGLKEPLKPKRPATRKTTARKKPSRTRQKPVKKLAPSTS